MSKIVNNRKRKHSDVIETPTHFLSLPNEILTMIFQKLSPQDRAALASTNRRLNGVELKAGYRSFTSIEFQLRQNGLTVEALWNSRTNDFGKECFGTDSAHTAAVFLNNATTSKLKIEGLLDDTTYRSLQVLLKSIHFEKLWIKIESDNSCRIIRELLKGHTSVKRVKIHWSDFVEEFEFAKELLLELSPMEKYIIDAQQSQLAINDETFLHIVINSSIAADICVTRSTITSDALEKAFKMVYESSKARGVRCYVPRTEVEQWIRRLEQLEFTIFPACIVHRDSGAILRYVSVCTVVGMYSVTMTIFI